MSRELLIEKFSRLYCIDGGDDPDAMIGWAAQQPAWKTHAPFIARVMSLLADPANITPEMVTGAANAIGKKDPVTEAEWRQTIAGAFKEVT